MRKYIQLLDGSLIFIEKISAITSVDSDPYKSCIILGNQSHYCQENIEQIAKLIEVVDHDGQFNNKFFEEK